MAQKRSNVPRNGIRWSLYQASKEFRIDQTALTKKVAEAGIDPGADGFYSTYDISTAIAGDIHAEKLRECRERADHLELRNQKLRGELLPAADVYQALAQAYLDIKGEILGYSSLTDDQKDSLLTRLSEVEISGKSASEVAEEACSKQ
jgi:hypothetical protein